mgnify:CR=1 FL=1
MFELTFFQISEVISQSRHNQLIKHAIKNFHRHRHFVPNFTLRLEENFEKLAILAENRTLEHPPMFWDMLKVIVSVILSELYIE